MTRFLLAGLAAMLASLAAGCASPYADRMFTLGIGGFDEERIAPDVYLVSFAGNTGTSRSTVQTFWLHRSAELALEKGFAGFAIVSRARVDDVGELQVDGAGFSPPGAKPYFAALIRMLPGPVVTAPPRVFDAAALHAVLAPLVRDRCAGGNVCPHFKGYLQPAPSATPEHGG